MVSLGEDTDKVVKRMRKESMTRILVSKLTNTEQEVISKKLLNWCKNVMKKQDKQIAHCQENENIATDGVCYAQAIFQ